MKSNKGFTLIEVLISIALLGIICMGMLSAMASQYSLIRTTRHLTENVFEVQQELETTIESTKKDIKAGNPMAGIESYTLFTGISQRTVTGYPRTLSVNNSGGTMSLSTVVANMIPKDFEVAVISNVDVELNDGSTLSHVYVDTPAAKVKSNGMVLTDPHHVFLTAINRWYISRTGFNMPQYSLAEEIEKGTIYPRFPDDYMLIAGSTANSLTSLKKAYAGKHIVYTVTPASNSGKMGATAVSKSVFVSGLPMSDGLVVHLDASMINEDDSNLVTSGTNVSRWEDLSDEGNNAIQNDLSKQPELISERIGDIIVNGTRFETYVKFIRFDGNNDGLTISHDSSIDLNDFTVIVVARSINNAVPTTIVSKIDDFPSYDDSWMIGSKDLNKLGFYTQDSSSIGAIANEGKGLDDKWHFFTGSRDTTSNILSFQLDNEALISETDTTGNIKNSKSLTIGYDGNNTFSAIDVAEVIIYDRELTATELVSIHTYLADKYQPIPPPVTIYTLNPITETVIVGQPFPMPTTVEAYMSDSTIQNVAVNWSPSIIDTSTIGNKVSTATAITSPSKSTTLTVNVVDVVNLIDMSVIVEKGGSYVLPSQVYAKLSDSSVQLIEVTWDGLVDTSSIGVMTRIGAAVFDSTKTMTLTVTIVEKGVDSISLDKTHIIMNESGTDTLTATVLPIDASNKNVIWTSNNESIVTVSTTGVVSAKSNGKGTAIVTVTTLDGGFSASCLVEVLRPVTGITLNKSNMTLDKDDSETLIETFAPLNPSNQSVLWNSSDPSVASVINGEVTGLQAGTTTITVTAVDTTHGIVKANCDVTIINNEILATAITDGDKREFTITFNQIIIEADIEEGALKSGLGTNELTFEKGSNFTKNSDIWMTIKNVNGIQRTIDVRRSKKDWSYTN